MGNWKRKPIIDEDEEMVAWNSVTRDHVLRAIKEYDRLGPERFFAEHGFAPTTTYELVWEERRYPPKAILGTAYEFATGQRLASGDFEGGKSGAVKVLGQLEFHRPGEAPAEQVKRRFVPGNRAGDKDAAGFYATAWAALD